MESKKEEIDKENIAIETTAPVDPNIVIKEQPFNDNSEKPEPPAEQ